MEKRGGISKINSISKSKRDNYSKEEALKAKSRKISIYEGSAFSLMDGFGLRYITPYALFLGASNSFIGLLSSLPNLLGSLSQLPGSKVVERYSRKKIVVIGVLLQALMWLPLIAVGYSYLFLELSLVYSLVLLMVVYSFIIILGSFPGPAWSSWMRDLVPRNTSSYFGKRNMITGVVAIVCMFIAGWILGLSNSKLFFGFAIIFFLAFVGRAISTFLFTKKYEPKIQYTDGYYFSLLQFTKRMSQNNFGRFVIFMSLISFAVAIASPFFAVYMLKDLGFSYPIYTLIVMSSAVSILVFMPFWGKFADKYGEVETIKLTSFFIALIPFLWGVSYFLNLKAIILVLFLVATELFSGFIWAGLNLSSYTFIYKAVSRERMALCIAYNTILNAIGIFLGAIVGGKISSFTFPIFGMPAIIFVFVLSAGLRFLIVLVMSHMIKEVRQVEKFDKGEMIGLMNLFSPRYLVNHFVIRRAI